MITVNLIGEGISLLNNKKFDQAITKLNQALDQIKDKDSQIQQQIDIQFWLGRCYFEQAIKAKEETSKKLFEQAVEHNLERLRLAKQLEGENGIQKQINAQHWLGRCYLERAKKTKEKDFKRLFEQAVECFKQQLELAKQLEGENGIRKKINAKYWLGCCDFAQAIAIKDSKDSKDSKEHLKN